MMRCLALQHVRVQVQVLVQLRSVLACLLLPLVLAARHADKDPVTEQQWTVIQTQSSEALGSASQPSIRYGHTCAAFQGQLILSHGYFFDRQRNAPTWLSDTWSMQMQSPYTWKLLTPGISQEASHASYSSQSIPPAPCGRFGHADAILNDTMYMYGGHDGGVSRHGKQGYEPGYDFDELWSFDFINHRWAFIQPVSSSNPGQRYLAAMTGISHQLLVYGGSTEGQGDVWRFNLLTHTWSHLAPEPTPGGPTVAPLRRMGHTLTPVHDPRGGKHGFVMYGGRARDAQGQHVLSEDAWWFDLTTGTWKKLKLGSNGYGPPPARTYHAEAHTYVPVKSGKGANTGDVSLVGFIIGGTTTTPTLTCTKDAWAFALNCDATIITWLRLPDLNVPLYDTRAAADSRGLFVQGGHLCLLEPGFPYFYTNQVLQLDVRTYVTQLASEHGCPVPAKQLITEAPHAHGGAHDEL